MLLRWGHMMSEAFIFLWSASGHIDFDYMWRMCSCVTDLIWPEARVWGGQVHWEALWPGIEAVCLSSTLASPSPLITWLPIEVLVPVIIFNLILKFSEIYDLWPVAPRSLWGSIQPRPRLWAAVEAGRVIAGGGGGEPGGQGEILRWNRNRRLDLGDYPLQTLKLLCIYISGYNHTWWRWN